MSATKTARTAYAVKGADTTATIPSNIRPDLLQRTQIQGVEVRCHFRLHDAGRLSLSFAAVTLVTCRS